MAPPKDPSMVKPIERVLRSGLFGPWDKPDIEGLDPLPAGINPAKHRAWGTDSFEIFPNFTLLFWAPGWYLTYHYWPTSANTHVFEGNVYFVPATRWRAPISLDTDSPPPWATKLSMVLAWLLTSTGASCSPWRLQTMSIIWRMVVSGGGRANGYWPMRASVRLPALASAWPGGTRASTGALWR